MNWKIYELLYKIESPLHIGFHKLGYVNRTRYYVPGRVMWGAITAAFAQTKDKQYEFWGEFFKQKCILSYFYLYKAGQMFLPHFTPKGIMMGEKSIEQFEKEFIFSFAKTAVEAETGTAEDTSLHEVEFINPSPDLFLIGYLFLLKNNLKQINFERLKPTLNQLNIGGERRYGFGKITLAQEKAIKSENEKMTLFGINVSIEENNQSLFFKFSENTLLFSHLEADGTDALKIKGDIEPLVGREWIEKGPGQKITEVKIGWVPGSIILQPIPLKLSEYGILYYKK